MKKTNHLRLAVLCALISAASVNVWAADETVGSGVGVAYGTGSNAPKAENVAIGKGATIAYSNGVSAATGDVAIGSGSNINNYASQGGSIAIGKNAHIENMAGGAEATFALGQTTYSGSIFSSARIPADPTKVVGSIAIGDNTFARTGSTMIGSHNYKGELGDTTVDTAAMRASNLNVYATTIGANSFSNGAFTTATGVYNIISGEYNGGRSANGQKNFGATVTGALNSVESMDSSGADYYSGIANGVVGVANRTHNSNGALIFGAGNEITNSIDSISGLPGGLFSSSPKSAKDLAETLREGIRDNDGGGSTLAIGGGNKADWTKQTQITGVNNTVTGTNGNVAKLNYVSGYNNKVTNASNNIIMGNDRTVSADNTIAIGGLSSSEARSVANTTTIGYDAKASVADGVALGYKSNATVDKGAVGYDISTSAPSTETNSTWKATSAAVSVGDVDHGITRQITSVAAGTNDTDAVNVAQLKKAVANVADTNDTLVAGNSGLTLTGNTLSMNVTDTAGNAVTGSVDLSGLAGSAAAGPDTYTGDDDNRISINQGDNLNIKGGATEAADGNNISVQAAGDTLAIKLAKDVSGLDSITSNTMTAQTVNGDTVNAQTINGDTMNATTINGDMVTAKTVKAGDTVTINNNGIDMGGTKVTNLKAGDISANSTDAVTGAQLHATNERVQDNTNRIQDNTNRINGLNGRVNKLDNRLDKVGAGAAALAALHPLDFDPDAKWDFAAGYGNYAGSNAAAVGAYYRPNEDLMFSVAGTMGNGENMVNAGVSLKVGGVKGVSKSRVALGKEVLALKQEVAELKALLGAKPGAATQGANRTTVFPDVPSNHWAYEAVQGLADKGLVEGYPDGTFGGDKMMTRYEFASIIYRAVQAGALVDERLVKEFSPELALFRVDTIKKDKNGNPVVERVRVNHQEK